MESATVTSARFQEFQEQIDGQIASQTSAMQTLNQAVDKIQRQLEVVLACDDKRPSSSGEPISHRGEPTMAKLKLDMPKSDGSDPLEFDQIYSGRGDANLPTLDSVFEDLDETNLDNLDGDEEPTLQSNDVDVEAGEPETSRGPDKGKKI
ncbi:unnamed protein product [Cuscuta campestris]|uniref:Uncharacterized protein n=1 Tax=Cuscuta campestris TaxID=132261 RepID=A0A484NK14_9ASTE|nr:unnamed protein product [Cuscuta campestris]